MKFLTAQLLLAIVATISTGLSANESKEKAGTEDINIGVGELRETGARDKQQSVQLPDQASDTARQAATDEVDNQQNPQTERAIMRFKRKKDE